MLIEREWMELSDCVREYLHLCYFPRELEAAVQAQPADQQHGASGSQNSQPCMHFVFSNKTEGDGTNNFVKGFKLSCSRPKLQCIFSH